MTTVDDEVLAVSASSAFIGSVNLVGQIADKLLSFGQIVLIAAILGASPSADLYFLASIVPLTIGFVVGEPASRAFLTLLVRERDEKSAIALAASAFLLTLALTSVLTVAYDALAVVLVKVVTPAGSGDVWPWLAFSAIAPAMASAALLGGILTWRHEYAWAAARVPVASLSGLLLLGGAVLLTRDLIWIALALSAGYVIAAGALFVRVSVSLGGRWTATTSEESLRRAARARSMLIAPSIGGAIGGQVIVTIERVMAGTIGPGAVASISYARGIATAPIVFSQAVGASGYPRLVRAEAMGATEHLRESFLRGLRLSLYLGAAFSTYLVLFGPEAVATVLQRGEFGRDQSARVGGALVVLAAATFTGSLIVYLVSVIYGIGRFGAILWLELAIFGTYLVAAPLGLVFGGVRGLAFAFAFAQAAGVIAGSFIAASALRVRGRDLWLRVLRPVSPLVASVVGALAAYRLVVDHVAIRIGLRGDIRVGGALLCLVAMSCGVLFVSSLPEADQLRRFVLRRTASS
jgi:putative peptidoglycan lipid II flippase